MEIEHGEDEEDKECDVFETRVSVDSRSAHDITFRDVEELISTFSGDNVVVINNVNVQS